jgi:hypothetical protein
MALDTSPIAMRDGARRASMSWRLRSVAVLAVLGGAALLLALLGSLSSERAPTAAPVALTQPPSLRLAGAARASHPPAPAAAAPAIDSGARAADRPALDALEDAAEAIAALQQELAKRDVALEATRGELERVKRGEKVLQPLVSSLTGRPGVPLAPLAPQQPQPQPQPQQKGSPAPRRGELTAEAAAA